jgi:DNA phosphorothioation-associated putative methyltransferase
MIHTYRTAIKRKGPSRPLRDLLDYDPEVLDGTVLDYGCGYGEDVRHLEMKSDSVIRGYDPHFDGAMPYAQKFDTVLLIYVLNVLPSRGEREAVMRRIWFHVKPGGILFIATRSPKEIGQLKKKHGWKKHNDGFVTKKKTFQAGLSEMALRALALPLDYVEMTSIKGTSYCNLLIAKGRWNGR